MPARNNAASTDKIARLQPTLTDVLISNDGKLMSRLSETMFFTQLVDEISGVFDTYSQSIIRSPTPFCPELVARTVQGITSMSELTILLHVRRRLVAK